MEFLNWDLLLFFSSLDWGSGSGVKDPICKCLFHHILSKVQTTNMTHHCWCWPWSPWLRSCLLNFFILEFQFPAPFHTILLAKCHYVEPTLQKWEAMSLLFQERKQRLFWGFFSASLSTPLMPLLPISFIFPTGRQYSGTQVSPTAPSPDSGLKRERLHYFW